MIIQVEPSGVIFSGLCTQQTRFCTAINPAPITAVWGFPGRTQINVCRGCLEEMIRTGQWKVPGAKISVKYDIAAYDKAGRLMLTVDVRSNPPPTSAEAITWAADIHQNLTTHSAVPASPYFLLVGYPNQFFLWSRDEITEPHRGFYKTTGDAELLKLYLADAAQEKNVGAEYQRTIAVTAWLQAVAQAEDVNSPCVPLWFRASGLAANLYAGAVVLQTSQAEIPHLRRAS